MTRLRVWMKCWRGRRSVRAWNRANPVPPIYRIPPSSRVAVHAPHGDPVTTPAGAGYPPTPHQPGHTEETR